VTLAEAEISTRLAVLIGPESVRGPVLSAYDALLLAREIRRWGRDLPNGTEEFLAGCLRRRDRRLTKDAARDLVVLAVDYCGKRIMVY
jgi:hypothetical protein